ncbi:hypothetical protein [Marivita hallyeonensis]|uniref:Uncharacterized protein n=1 Tax=Marivita hallyeonensis TaxID=996342 RepID=A0A1M5Y4F8_9RHOB|nr:hypothetical protein [Marivita hallyeonensis]SHI06688.1 hypothetical protein SAMN05443551_0059 [Marivita hallyeonensis]
MKRLVTLTALALLPTMGHAACSGDLTDLGSLNVFTTATSEAVIGGIGANQCGIEVTDFCEGDRCLVFYSGLSGYIDIRRLVSGTFDPPPAEFVYTVSDAQGTVTFMGREQPFGMDDDTRPLRVVPAADHVMLYLPAPLTSPVRMTSTGSSGWEGTLPDWAGLPIPVSLYLDQLSAPQARMELFADSDMVKMNVMLFLDRDGGPELKPREP